MIPKIKNRDAFLDHSSGRNDSVPQQDSKDNQKHISKRSQNLTKTSETTDNFDKVSSSARYHDDLLTTPNLTSPGAKKNRISADPKKLFANEALARIVTDPECNDLLKKSISKNIPELFIDLKEKAKRIPNCGRDVIRRLNNDRAASVLGRTSSLSMSWGRVFIYLPWDRLLLSLDNLASIDKDVASMTLLEGIVDIGNIGELQTLQRDDLHATAARLDLVFRFALLGCSKSIVTADRFLTIIPQADRPKAYSFAMQESVLFEDMTMISYCLQNSGHPISPYDGLSDSRNDSPIEIAFQTSKDKIKTLLLNNLDGKRDIPELKELFLDTERWAFPPEQITDYIKKFENALQ